MFRNRTPVLTAMLLFLVALCGCSGPELDKVVVRGTVTHAGEPIKNGEIRFHPIEGTKGPVSGAAIRDGRYEATGKGGVPVGVHRVTIRAYRPKTNGPPPEPGEKPFFEQWLPDKYHQKSKLETTIPGDRSTIELDFNLER